MGKPDTQVLLERQNGMKLVLKKTVKTTRNRSYN